MPIDTALGNRSSYVQALNEVQDHARENVQTGGQYVMVAGDDTAGLTDIVTGLSTITAYVVTITTSAGVDAKSDAVITDATAGTIRIADGSTYACTATHIVNWIAIGTV